jgi:hypothetical protein
MTSGVDTLSLAWRPHTDHPFDAMREVGFTYGPSGSMICSERGPGDERIVAFPTHGVLAIEGRLGATLNRDPDDHELVPARFARDAEQAGEQLLHDVLAYRPDGQTICEVRRFDLATELRFDQGADGIAFLRTLGGMHPARTRTTLEVANDGRVETVYVRTPKRGDVLQRLYDKGVEAASNPPGERIRLESQQRPSKRERVSPGALGRLDLRSHFIRRMEPYVKNGNDLVTAGSEAAVDELLGRVARDELTLARAERLIGSLAVLRIHGRAIYDERQGRRRLQSLREAGVALEDELPPDRVVPVGQLLRDAVQEFAA